MSREPEGPCSQSYDATVLVLEISSPDAESHEGAAEDIFELCLLGSTGAVLRRSNGVRLSKLQ